MSTAPAGSRATRGLLPHLARFAMTLGLRVALGFIVVSPTPARSDPPTGNAMAPQPIASGGERSYLAHPIFFDVLVGSAAIGVVNGVVQGQCNGEGFQGNMVVGAAFVGGFFGLFVGQSWGGEDAGPSHHPPTSVSTFRELRRRVHGGDRIEVRTINGATVSGQLVRIKNYDLVIKGSHGRSTIEEGSICEIATLRDPSWDGAVWGTSLGALYAWIYASTCHREPGASVSGGEMALMGGAVLGAFGFVSDVLHNGRSLVFSRTHCASNSIRLVPSVTRNGGRLVVALNF